MSEVKAAFYDEWDSYDGLVGTLNAIDEYKHRGWDWSIWAEQLAQDSSRFICELHLWSERNERNC